MYNDLERFISFTEREGFDKDQKLVSSLYPHEMKQSTLLELCCYHGAVDCFKLLRTKFNSEITYKCLISSFLGGNPEIMSECLKHHKPDKDCMKYAIISHNIDFVTFLMNEYNIDIYIRLYHCIDHKNLESFLVYFDLTNDINTCFVYSACFNIPSICEYFLSLGADIMARDYLKSTALHNAAYENSKEAAEFLISHGININEIDNDGKTALHEAAYKIVKKQLNFLFYMVQISMKKINMEKLLFMLQQKIIVKKPPSFLYHMVRISMKKKDMGKPHFIMQHFKIVKKQPNFLFHMV
ncbi:ankyrin repeat protein, putative [Trichomonas vaginalis G3]|uniref:Ankyrin repeat protein, putative n=1 Tax=Trichomonas vaginalis (strain ATCC PRA-98 / G3) TaxID=412133 RepID=A2ESD6_TRIV3|nr:protein of unknown function (DUF3447) [Trichomonas vaginalis G3]EAY04439.1 ankyrin repeat protein, putative [Trichomonas vaginalis G3]KAI5502199.1 protein of unknown function (DUF3447) [Trichomonas vaginalis G3]|eukprot:XP_001316662.1 ankyrin repeat protein [Trichomonas vaginalis G3]